MKNKLLLLLLICAITTGLFTSCSSKATGDSASDSRTYYSNANDLDGTRAACPVGMIDDILCAENYPNASIQYYNTSPDCIKAVQTNKADFFLVDEFTAVAMRLETDDLKMLNDRTVAEQHAAAVFAKGSASSKLYMEMQEFISKHLDDGKFEEIKFKWTDPSIENLDDIEKYKPELSGNNGTIRIGTDPASTPIVYLCDDGLEGLDVEIARMFAYEYGYDIDWVTSDFSGLIPAVSSGKIDFALCGIAITDERAQAVDFTDSYIASYLYPVVAKEVSSKWSWDGIKHSFESTFIKENRWKVVADGLLLTIRITLFSTLLGSILGFLVYLLCRKGNKFANGFFDGFAKLMSGLPMVVVLMILYYIVFGNTSISGSFVAVVAFSVSLMLGVYSMLKTSVKSIDRGQIEGAISLGFTDRQTFFNIVLPQAMTQFIPNYLNELISLLKGTAIVGYIAVQDLTKVSDVIRSRTYDAFFPLIATALIYLVIVIVISLIVGRIAKHYQPKLRSDDKVLKQYK